MNPTNLANTAVFQKLRKHAEKAGKWSLKELFRNDPGRFPAMTLTAGGLFLDFSKNFLTKETLSLLLELAKECDLEKIRDRMFEGDKINTTEHRAVLHTALRAPRYEKVLVDGKNVIPDIQAVLDQMRRFSEKIHSGEWKGFTGKPITDIVNIGIGGSDVGPRMVCQAMRPFHIKELNVHFVANVDGHDLDMVLNRVRPETTLFIIASKTFTTLETMLNAHSARSWFLNHGTIRDIQKHFVAISTNREAVEKFGIHHDNLFPFWDWVGGRYSVWSAIGLPVVLAIGYNHFTEFLAGAHAMDVHFRYAPLASNMPGLLGLTGIWNRNFLGCTPVSVAPYLQDLVSFSKIPATARDGKQRQAGTEKRRTRHLWKLSCHLGKCRNQWATCLFSVTASGNRNHSCRFAFVALSPHHTLSRKTSFRPAGKLFRPVRSADERQNRRSGQ